MAGNDTVTTWTSGNGAVAGKGAEKITAAHFQEMLDIIDTMNAHGHTFYDDYSTNCDCNCQRGSL